MHSATLPAAGIAFAAIALAQNAPQVTFTPSVMASGAEGVSEVLSPSFAGMGIEPSNLFSFTGFQTPNQLSINCLNNLANYTGVPPYIRLGGNTQDYMIWRPDYQAYNLMPNPAPTGQGAYASDSIFFGPGYFRALDRFPTGTPVTFGLNMAYDGDAYGGYLDHIVREADGARTTMKNVHLQAFEVGNEPDLWLENGFRTGAWDGTVYAQQWTERAQAVWEQVLQPNGLPSNFFEPGCTASTIPQPSFEISDLAQTEIASQAPGSNNGYINAWSQHDYYYYIGVTDYALTLDQMMDLSTTVTQFAAWVQQVQQAQDTPYPYVLREMASVGPVGQVGISDTFGATLWTLNFFLYTAGLNIKSVEFHMTDTSYASPWQPIAMDIFDTPPHVRSSYAAWAAMAQLIGPGCSTQVIGLPIDQYPAGYENRMAAYNTYQNGRLASIIMINTLQRNSTAQKGRTTFTFNLPQLAGRTFYLSYLTAPGAESTMGTTWNGVSYQMSGDGTPVVINSKVDSVRVPQNGQVSFSVRDTQAVVATLGSVVGSDRSVRGTKCANLAQNVSPPQGEDQQQRHPISVRTAADAANPSGYNNYNTNGQASGARSMAPGAGGAQATGSGSGQGNGAATVMPVSGACVAIAGAIVGGFAMLL